MVGEVAALAARRRPARSRSSARTSNSYGRDLPREERASFAELLRAVAAVDGHRPRAVHLAAPEGHEGRRHRGDGRVPGGGRASAPAGPVRQHARAQGDAAHLQPRALSGPGGAAARRDPRPVAHHRPDRRVPGRDRGRLRATPSAWWRSAATTAPTRSSIPPAGNGGGGAPARRRPAGREARAHRPPGRGGAAHRGRAGRAVRRHGARGAGRGPVAHRPRAPARPPAPEHHGQLHRRRRRRARSRRCGSTARPPRRSRACSSARPSRATSSPPSRGPPRVLALAGPTASGKSALAHAAALGLGGEIVLADPFGRYRGLEIAADSPRADALAEVPHHAVGDLALTEASTAASFAAVAHPAIDAALAAGRVPVVTGGTGLYLRAALADLRFPDAGHPRPARLGRAPGPRGPRRRARRAAARATRSGRTGSTPPTRAAWRVPSRSPRGRRGGGRRPLDRTRPPSHARRGPDPPAPGARPPASPSGCGGSWTRASSRSWSAALDTPGVAREPLQVIGAKEVAAIRAGALDPGRPARSPGRPHPPPGPQAAHLAAPDAGRHVARPGGRARRGRPCRRCWRCGRGPAGIRYPPTR